MSNRCAVLSLSSSIIITESATIKGSGTRYSKRKNASVVLTGRCDVVSDWAACSVITTAPPHRSSGAPAGRNGWSGGEVCSGAPIAEPVPRRLVSANLENASRIRAFGSVRIFGHDGPSELAIDYASSTSKPGNRKRSEGHCHPHGLVPFFMPTCSLAEYNTSFPGGNRRDPACYPHAFRVTTGPVTNSGCRFMCRKPMRTLLSLFLFFTLPSVLSAQLFRESRTVWASSPAEVPAIANEVDSMLSSGRLVYERSQVDGSFQGRQHERMNQYHNGIRPRPPLDDTERALWVCPSRFVARVGEPPAHRPRGHRGPLASRPIPTVLGKDLAAPPSRSTSD